MKDIFNIKRFYSSFLRLISEKGVKMIGSIVLFILFAFVLLNIETSPGIYKELQITFLVLGLTFGPVLYMSIVSNEMSSNSKGMAYLLMPNSLFEKWLLNSVFAIVIYFTLFCGLYYLLDSLMIEIVSSRHNLPDGFIEPVDFFNRNTNIGFMAGSALGLGVNLGSLYFKKNNFVYSSMIMFGMFILIFVINHFSANFFFDEYIYFGESAPYASVFVENENSLSGGFQVGTGMSKIGITSLIFMPFIIAFSGIYFLRLKEKEL